MAWTVEFHDAARRELKALPLDLQARITRIVVLVENNGPDELAPKDIKYLGDGLWEFRVKGRDGIARALHVRRTGQRLVVVRAFVKKTQKTPPRELRLARSRAAEV